MSTVDAKDLFGVDNPPRKLRTIKSKDLRAGLVQQQPSRIQDALLSGNPVVALLKIEQLHVTTHSRIGREASGVRSEELRARFVLGDCQNVNPSSL